MKILICLILVFDFLFAIKLKCINEQGHVLEFNKYKKNSVILNDIILYNIIKTFDTKNYTILEIIVDNTMMGTIQFLNMEDKIIFHLNGEKNDGYTSVFDCKKKKSKKVIRKTNKTLEKNI